MTVSSAIKEINTAAITIDCRSCDMVIGMGVAVADGSQVRGGDVGQEVAVSLLGVAVAVEVPVGGRSVGGGVVVGVKAARKII